MDCESSALTNRSLLQKWGFHKGAFVIAHIGGLYLMWYLINSWRLLSENLQPPPPPPPEKFHSPFKNSKSESPPSFWPTLQIFQPPPAERLGGHCELAFLLLVVLFSITDLDMMYFLRKIFPPSEVLEVCIYSHLQCFLREKIPPVGAWEILAGGNLTRSDSDHLNLLES